MLVVNSQMLQRFATDTAVTRLIIVDKDGDNASGKILYNGPPNGMSDELVASLGDGYTIDFSAEGIAKQKVADEAAAAVVVQEEVVEKPTPEILEAAAAATKKMQGVKGWPDPYQQWFKGCLQKGEDGIKQIIGGVGKVRKNGAF